MNNIYFNIEYHTNWGEEVRLTGSIDEFGNWNEEKCLPLHTTDGIRWFAEIQITTLPQSVFQYIYCIFKNGILIRKEWSMYPRILSPVPNKQSYICYDHWRDTPEQSYFYSSAYTKCLFQREKKPISPTDPTNKTVLIKVLFPNLTPDYSLAICGNQPELGNWDMNKSQILDDTNFPEWQISLGAENINYPLEYKYLLYDRKKKRFEEWEIGSNHFFSQIKEKLDSDTLIISEQNIHFNLPLRKFAGVAIPVFSLRSKKSYGIGDFGDLKKMIDWAITTNQKIVQILPINDTTMYNTWADSYPYNGISIYALHPMYINITQLGKIEDQEKRKYFSKKQKELNSYITLDYEEVNRVKWEYLRLIYEQEGKKILGSPGFQVFFNKNNNWLQPYAAFSYLRDKYKTPDFRKWPSYINYAEKEISLLCDPTHSDYDQIAIYYYIQYQLHLQLLKVSTYARENNIILKGDIPIGISKNSVEAWTEPHYFNLEGQAGAPPDNFSINGQNWGFPTYNWDIMEKDGYQWWIKRFQKMAEYFDAYRIDHILGFFRIWQIPTNAVHGLLGQFVPSIPMSKYEIESYGLVFNEELFLKPYIHEEMLTEIFGSQVDIVRTNFIQPRGDAGFYEMRPEFDTQRKIEAHFIDKSDDENIAIRDGLYSLVSDVLFIRDFNDPTKFHPRISVQHDYIFRTLSDNEKNIFNHLYDQYFYYRHNDFWYQQAIKKLPSLTGSTQMLVCGEDLGMIPASVEIVMKELSILSLDIQRMPKTPMQEFGQPDKYPYLSVCSISTHDMSTFRGWWKENREQTQHYFNTILHYEGTPPDNASGKICEEVIEQHLSGNSMLCILAWQDWLSLDEELRNPNIDIERINIPADPKHYWRYRMHLNLEELVKAENLNAKIRKLINNTRAKQ